jgi:hypothetical protein
MISRGRRFGLAVVATALIAFPSAVQAAPPNWDWLTILKDTWTRLSAIPAPVVGLKTCDLVGTTDPNGCPKVIRPTSDLPKEPRPNLGPDV